MMRLSARLRRDELPHLFLAAVLALSALAACGGNDDDLARATTSSLPTTTTTEKTDDHEDDGDKEDGDTPPAAAAATVTLKNLAFDPKEVTVKKGDTVKWHWDDGAIPHNVTGKGWASKTQDKGDYSHAFDKSGTYPYTCTLHPGMNGEVKVT